MSYIFGGPIARQQAAIEACEYNMRLGSDVPIVCEEPIAESAPVEPRYTLGIYHPRTGHRYNSVCGGRLFTYDEAVSKRNSLNSLSGMTGTICRLEEV